MIFWFFIEVEESIVERMKFERNIKNGEREQNSCRKKQLKRLKQSVEKRQYKRPLGRERVVTARGGVLKSGESKVSAELWASARSAGFWKAAKFWERKRVSRE